MQHNKPLDGLRSWAVIAVMLFHSGFPGCGLGWLGVDFFFGLSGYLITTLLISEYQSSGTIRLSYFWARRFLRLMPIYWLFVGAVTALIMLRPGAFVENPESWSKSKYIASLWLYFNNYFPAGDQVFRFNQAFTSHLWSLSVEEQFYFLWPPVVLVALRTKSLLWVGLALVLGSATCVLLIDDPLALRRHLYTRGSAILIGSLAAVVAAHPSNVLQAKLNAIRPGFPIVALGVLLAAAYGSSVLMKVRADDHIRSGWTLLINSSFAVLLIAMVRSTESRWAKLLAWGPFVYLGRISYGIYLYHVPVHHLCWDTIKPLLPVHGAVASLLTQGLYLLLSVGIAAASFKIIELPFLRLKKRFR